MRQLCAVLLLAGCAGASVHYDVENVRGAYGAPGTHVVRPAGSCRLAVRIRVIDEQHAPVAGAHLVVSRQVRAQASEENMGTDEYRTRPVRTDRQGLAHVCSPADLPPVSSWEGIGGGFTIRGTAKLEVSDDHGGIATSYEPFAPQIVLRSATAVRPGLQLP